MELKLRYYGDPVLRRPADEVEAVDDDVRAFAHAMIETMYREKGIGLAAPQVGASIRLLVALQMKDVEDTEAEPLVVINPRIVSRSQETWKIEEGCLSIPEVNGEVQRPERITVTYTGIDGERRSLDAEGMFARVLQHEIDHLDGKLFIDYLSPAKKSVLKPKLKEIAARYSS